MSLRKQSSYSKPAREDKGRRITSNGPKESRDGGEE